MAAQSPVPSSFDRAVLAGNWPVRHPDGTYRIASSSHPGTDHVLIVSQDGISCSCEAGRYGQPDCKHRAALRYCLLHGIMGQYVLCAVCERARVAKHGAICPGCQSLVSIAQQNDVRLGLQEPPTDPTIFNRRQMDGTYRPLADYFQPARASLPDAAFTDGWDTPTQATAVMPVNPLEEMFL